jgi:outer membrane lipoprotein-sorting protein
MKIPLVVLCALLASVKLPAENLNTILARMDEASQSFKAVSANVQMTTFTKVINDKTIENGTLEMQRQKGKGTRAIIDFSRQSDARIISFFGSTIRIYYPKLKLYQDYNVGQSSDVLNQYLLLGFGSSGKELMESYDITSAGEETVAGQEATKLVLTPKAEKVRETLSKVEVWIPQGMAYPLQQKFSKPSGDDFTTRYSDIKLNPAIKGNLEFKPPPGTKKQGS